jgi:hypothetical protein
MREEPRLEREDFSRAALDAARRHLASRAVIGRPENLAPTRCARLTRRSYCFVAIAP